MSVTMKSRAPGVAPQVLRTHRRSPQLDGRAVAALALGAAGLVLFNLVFGPFAVVLGLRAAVDRRTGRFGRIGGLIGAGLGLLDLIVFGLLLTHWLSGSGFHWHLGG